MPPSGSALPSDALAASGVEPSADPLREQRVEAARYALLRRITPALRHHLVGAMQPIGMIAAMLERRTQAATPDLPGIQKKSTEMGQLSREATATCIALIGWVSPKQAEPVALSAGVLDCLHVLETDLALRGFSVVNEVAAVPGEWPREALRSVFPAAALALTDAAQGPAELVLSAKPDTPGPRLVAALRPREGTHTPFAHPAWRALTRDDVQALAEDESVELVWDGNQGFELRCLAAD